MMAPPTPTLLHRESCTCGFVATAQSREAAAAAIMDHAGFHLLEPGLRDALRSGFCRRTEATPRDPSAPR